MSFWFWLGVGGVLWLLIGTLGLALGRACKRPVPLREEPDLWGDVELEPWPHEDGKRAA